MAIKIDFPDLSFGDSFYLKSDEDQLEHHLVRVILDPGSTNKKGEMGVAVKFRLSYMGEIVEVYDFETTTEPDKLKMINKKGDEDD